GTVSAGHGDLSSTEKRTWLRKIPGGGVFHLYLPVEFIGGLGPKSGAVEGRTPLVVTRDGAQGLGIADEVLDAAVARSALVSKKPERVDTSLVDQVTATNAAHPARQCAADSMPLL